MMETSFREITEKRERALTNFSLRVLKTMTSRYKVARKVLARSHETGATEACGCVAVDICRVLD